MKKLTLAVLISTALLSGCVHVPAITGIDQNQTKTTTIFPVREGLQQGTLSNGMKYIVVPNETNGARVSLQLIVHAGSLDEADDQQGIAHLVEHMAFNGTEDFPANTLIEHQEALGMVFGRDINAMTEYRTTSYFLHLPNNSPAMLKEGFHMLAQQMSALTFDDAELEKERPVVEEEWRGGRNMMARLGQANRQLVLAGSRYAAREPIGDMDLVRHVDAQRIKDFWQTWYHPNNMTLLVVGQTDQASIESLLNEYFAPMPSKALPPRAPLNVQLPHNLTFATIADPEITTEVISLSLRGKQATVTDSKSLQQDMTNDIVMMMLSRRLTEQYQVEGEDITRMVATAQPMLPGYSNNRIVALLHTQDYASAYQTLFGQLSSFAHYGFSELDFNVAKASVLQRYRQIADNQRNTTNSRLLMSMFNQLRNQQPLLDHELIYQQADRLLENTTLEQVNDHFKAMIHNRSPLAVVQLSPKHQSLLPTEADVQQWWTTALANPSEIGHEQGVPAALFAERPEPASVISETIADGTYIWRFANGASVWFMPDDQSKQQLMIRWQGLGGTEHLPESMQRAAQLAARNMGQFGYANLSAVQLSALNSAYQMRQMAFVTPLSHGISGSTDSHSFENWLQNLNLRMTQPQTDADIWQSKQKMIARGIENRNTTPDGQFNQAIDAIRYADNPMMLPLTDAQLNTISVADLQQGWLALFSHAADHQLVIVGDEKPEVVRDLAARYIGHLPKGKAFADKVLPALAGGDHDINVAAGHEPVGVTSELFNVAFPYSQDAERQAGLVSRMLSVRLREQLREAAGGVYSLRFGIRLDRERQQAYGMLSYSHQPERGDELSTLANTVIAQALSEGFTEQELAEVKQQTRTSLQPEVLTSRHRFSWLTDNASDNMLLSMPDDYLYWLENVNVTELDALANAILSTSNRIDARLTPEK
ncbi:M16 family metallopeptidase [Photobacterium nomapromontoriensis]|uniref:M16 family metallopeptidase n=1 Tax=Photobacterium nomapromontoriensis TaxID=2910237 RepID=UPI003D0CC51D